MPIKFTGAGTSRLLSSSSEESLATRPAWLSPHSTFSKMPGLAPIRDDEDRGSGGCCMPSPTSAKRQHNKGVGYNSMVRDDTYESQLTSESQLPPPAPSLLSQAPDEPGHRRKLAGLRAMRSLELDTHNQHTAGNGSIHVECHTEPKSQKQQQPQPDSGVSSSHFSECMYESPAALLNHTNPSQHPRQQQQQPQQEENHCSLRIDTSDSHGYYSELSREDGLKMRGGGAREIIRCKNGISGHKLRDYQRSRFYKMSDHDKQLIQFTIAQLERVTPKALLRNAELALYSADPIQGCNPVFQSGNRKHKFLSIHQHDTEPEFIHRTQSPGICCWKKTLLVFAIFLLVGFLSCYIYMVVLSLTEIVIHRLTTAGLKVHVTNNGVTQVRMSLSGQPAPYGPVA